MLIGASCLRKQNKGTLIYALQNYPAEPIFPQAIDWALTGVYEVAWMAMDIIMNVESVDLDVYLAAEKKIQLMLTTKDLGRVLISNQK